MRTINNFILENIFFPTAMLAYVVFTGLLIRLMVNEWLKEREEKKNKKHELEGPAK